MTRKPLHIILLVAFVDLVAFGLIIPLQAIYADRFGASGTTLGLLIGVFALMQFIFNPILGRLSDRIGRRPVLVLSLAGSVASHILLGVADLAHSLPLLFLARILDGVTGANIATTQAYIADVTTDEDRAKAMGLFGAAFGCGFVVGPAMAALLAAIGKRVVGADYGTSWPAFGAAVVAAIALFIVWRWLPESKTEPGPSGRGLHAVQLGDIREVVANRRLRELLTVMFTGTFAIVLYEITLVYLCRHQFGMNEVGIGLMFVYFGILMIIVQGKFVGPLSKRFGEPRLIAVGPFVVAAGYVGVSGIPFANGDATQATALAWLLLLGAAIPIAVGSGLVSPSLNSLVSRQAPAGRRGITLGVSHGTGYLARALAPPLGGLLYDQAPYWPYWLGATMFGMIGVFAMVILPVQARSLIGRVASAEANSPEAAAAAPGSGATTEV